MKTSRQSGQKSQVHSLERPTVLYALLKAFPVDLQHSKRQRRLFLRHPAKSARFLAHFQLALQATCLIWASQRPIQLLSLARAKGRTRKTSGPLVRIPASEQSWKRLERSPELRERRSARKRGIRTESHSSSLFSITNWLRPSATAIIARYCTHAAKKAKTKSHLYKREGPTNSETANKIVSNSFKSELLSQLHKGRMSASVHVKLDLQ